MGLVLPRSVDLVVATLATLKTGAAYLPVPDYPEARIATILKDVPPTLLVTRESIVLPPATEGIERWT